MLRATIGLICDGAAAAVDADANDGPAQSATAAQKAVNLPDTPPSMVTLLIEERALDEKIHHVKVRYGDSQLP